MPGRDASVLGSYVLPGPTPDPRPVVGQTLAAEQLGMGAVWLSELQGPTKDAGAILGYLAHATDHVGLGTSITHFGTRHPMVLASWGATMQTLTGGRFRFGFGRSVAGRWRTWGLPVPTTASMEDYATILRRLWNHETFSYDGPAGSFPRLGFEGMAEVDPPPLLLAAIGPKTLALVGRAFDGALLHPFLTPDAVARSRAVVRKAAEDAGRDPDSVTVYCQPVTAPDLTEDECRMVVGARATAYFSHPTFADPLIEMNGWDPAHLATIREAVRVATAENEAKGRPLQGRALLVEPSKTIPNEWLESSSAIGTPAECAKRLHEYLDAGADEIVVHGTTPDRLGPTVEAFTRG
jgi:probable F420-dependent oxidoreductase